MLLAAFPLLAGELLTSASRSQRCRAYGRRSLTTHLASLSLPRGSREQPFVARLVGATHRSRPLFPTSFSDKLLQRSEGRAPAHALRQMRHAAVIPQWYRRRVVSVLLAGSALPAPAAVPPCRCAALPLCRRGAPQRAQPWQLAARLRVPPCRGLAGCSLLTARLRSVQTCRASVLLDAVCLPLETLWPIPNTGLLELFLP